MYPFAGQPWKAAAELADVARTSTGPTIDGLPGNDDLGGLSAWHALDMLGLGALVPGAPYFALGSPAFERAEIDTGDGTFTIESPGSGPYVVGRVAERRAARPGVDPRLGDDRHAAARALDHRERGLGRATTGRRAGPTSRPSAAASGSAALPLRLALLGERAARPRGSPRCGSSSRAARPARARGPRAACPGCARSSLITRLLPGERQRRVRADLGGQRRARPRSSSSGSTTRFTSPIS